MFIGLFELIETTSQALATNLTNFFFINMDWEFFFAYVEDERSNLITMTTTLKSIIKCEVIDLNEKFQGNCFGHVFSKACQYAITNEKVCKNLWFISIKYAQLNLQKCVTWPKNQGRVDRNGTRHV